MTTFRVWTSAELAAAVFDPVPVVPDIPEPNKPEPPHDAPVTMWGGETVSVERAYQILDKMECKPDPIRHRWGDWIITDFGVECLSDPYFIPWSRMGEEWVQHLCEKNWPVHEDVQNVFAKARSMPEAQRR